MYHADKFFCRHTEMPGYACHQPMMLNRRHRGLPFFPAGIVGMASIVGIMALWVLTAVWAHGQYYRYGIVGKVGIVNAGVNGLLPGQVPGDLSLIKLLTARFCILIDSFVSLF